MRQICKVKTDILPFLYDLFCIIVIMVCYDYDHAFCLIVLIKNKCNVSFRLMIMSHYRIQKSIDIIKLDLLNRCFRQFND